MTVRLPDDIRARCPIFEHTIYLNSCSQGALSDSVRDAYHRYLDDWAGQGSPWDAWVGRLEAVRERLARLLHADATEVAVTTSVSAGASALASALTMERRKIVLTDFEFPTIGQVWHAQELRGATVEHVPQAEDGTIPLEHFDKAIDEDTALVSVTHICYRNGSRLDVPGIVELAHDRGVPVLLDAFQSVGAVPLDVGDLGVDFLVGGTLKYLMGSPGAAFLYCRSEHLERLVPTVTGWFADEDVHAMDITDYSPHPSARRFESGTPTVPSLYAAEAALGLVEDIGVEATAAHVRTLNRRLLEGLDRIGATVVTPRDEELRGPLIAVASRDGLVERLADHGIVTSSRDANLRISAHCYNTPGDIDTLLEVLDGARALLE